MEKSFSIPATKTKLNCFSFYLFSISKNIIKTSKVYFNFDAFILYIKLLFLIEIISISQLFATCNRLHKTHTNMLHKTHLTFLFIFVIYFNWNMIAILIDTNIYIYSKDKKSQKLIRKLKFLVYVTG